MIIDEKDYLEHFGVKGMRWGQRKNRSAQGRADRLKSHAEKRPTRGNVRKAERAQRQVDSRNRKIDRRKALLNRSSEERRADRTSKLVGLGSGAVTGMFLAGRTGSLTVAVIGGTGVGLAGSKFVNSALAKDRAMTAKVLKAQSK